MDENMNTGPASHESSSAGPIIGAIVILAAIVFGALYFMNDKEDSQALDGQVNAIEAQSESDETADIEADLENTEIENLDAELNTY